MTDTAIRDLSEHNPFTVADVISKTKQRVVLFRSNDGTHRDAKYTQNAASAKSAADHGHLDCFGIYLTRSVQGVTWQQAVDTCKAMVGKPHPLSFYVIDVEAWGHFTGDESADINHVRAELIKWLRKSRGPVAAKVDLILRRQPKRVLVYGNAGDLNALYQHRPRGLRIVLANYSSNPPYPGKIAHQYTDRYTGDGLPAGDMSSADGLTPHQFAAKVGCVRLTFKERIALFRAHSKKKGK